jgi:hypothetical protein
MIEVVGGVCFARIEAREKERKERGICLFGFRGEIIGSEMAMRVVKPAAVDE